MDAVADLLRRWGEVLGVYKGRTHDTAEAQALAGMEKAYKRLQKMYAEAFAEANAVEDAVGSKADSEVKYSERITADMSDAQRAEVLKKKNITNIPAVTNIPDKILQRLESISSWDDINNLFGSEKRTLIQKIASEFGVFKGYKNEDINISFEFSNNNYRESYGKQKKDFENFAKMFSVFDSVVNNAIGIEIHKREDYKPDPTLENVYVLISAFEDGDFIVPVKLEVKEFKDKQNTLYVAISLQTIKKTEVSKQGSTENGVAQGSRSATISVADLMRKVNPLDTNFTKYFPDELLTDEQRKGLEPNSVKSKLSERNTAYMDAVKRGDMETAQKLVDEAAKEAGYPIRAYHGTARGDRVGNVFLPERATSGPMAYFTSDKTIAENYSKSKKDTSMAYDPDYDRYETQFRVKKGDKDIAIYQAWSLLPFDVKQRITKKAGQVHENWDGDYELIVDESTDDANGGFKWQLKEQRGNALSALVEQWLNSGTLYGDESRFLDVLDMVGVTSEFKSRGWELYFKDPDAKHEKVYDVYLGINNPFDTANLDEKFIDSLEEWYENQDQDKYMTESSDADLWDKNNIDAYEFANRLRSDLENNTTHAWTSIPDSVTDYLKSLKYDGIQDTGGKYSGETHIVYIPFYSEQIKSAESVTYDDNGDVIPLSERFKKSTPDIRYSQRNPREVTESDVRDVLDNIEDYHKDSYFPVRINTPRVLIDAAKKRGDVIDNLPVVMQVKKARQAMSDEATRSSIERPHGLSTDDMIAILRAMDNPTYIVYQENERYAEIVRFETESKQRAIAILEIGENKNAIHMNGYEGGIYQVLVTAFVPDDYQYIKDILDNKKNKVLSIEKKGNSQRSSGSHVPSLLNESPFFKDSVPQKEETVKRKFSDSIKKDVRFSSRDTSKVHKDISNFVDKSISQKNHDTSVTISLATQFDNKAINRLGNTWRGKYVNVERTFTSKYVRHVLNNHGDPVIEALRGQLHMDTDAIKIALSNLRDGKGRVISGTYSSRGNPTLVTEIPINGYTLYAEEPIKTLSSSELQGRTMYMTPTSARMLIQGNIPVNISKRQSGGHGNIISAKNRIVNGFLVDSNGNDMVVNYIEENSQPKQGFSTQGLIVLSNEADVISRYQGGGKLRQAKVSISNPYIVTVNNNTGDGSMCGECLHNYLFHNNILSTKTSLVNNLYNYN